MCVCVCVCVRLMHQIHISVPTLHSELGVWASLGLEMKDPFNRDEEY